jgi:hypothetical protein
MREDLRSVAEAEPAAPDIAEKNATAFLTGTIYECPLNGI